MKVLVADDEAAVRALVRRILTREFGVEVVEAGDGAAALSCLLDERVDLLITDLTMPVMGGLEALASIRASREHAGLPVVVMTAHAGESDFLRAKELGISGFVVKPFSVPDLRARLAPIVRPLQENERLGVRQVVPLAVEPAQRALLVDQAPEFVEAAERLLSRLCRVEIARHEFAVIKSCTDAPPDILIVGLTSTLMPAEALAAKIRTLTAARPVRIVAAAAAADLPRLGETGLFDAVFARSFDAAALETNLRPAFDEPTRARFLLHPASAWLADAFAGLAASLGDRVGVAPSMYAHRQASGAAARWMSSDVEVQGARLGCLLRIRAPFTIALEVGRRAGIEADEVSGARALDAIDRKSVV